MAMLVWRIKEPQKIGHFRTKRDRLQDLDPPKPTIPQSPKSRFVRSSDAADGAPNTHSQRPGKSHPRAFRPPNTAAGRCMTTSRSDATTLGQGQPDVLADAPAAPAFPGLLPPLPPLPML